MLLGQMTRFETLQAHKYVVLTTFRKDGQPVTITVPFAQDGDCLYIMLRANADDAKRIHENAQVEVAPCDAQGVVLGSSVEAMAMALTDVQAARAALRQKFGLAERIRELTHTLRREPCVYLEITPM